MFQLKVLGADVVHRCSLGDGDFRLEEEEAHSVRSSYEFAGIIPGRYVLYNGIGEYLRSEQFTALWSIFVQPSLAVRGDTKTGTQEEVGFGFDSRPTQRFQ